MRCGAGKGKANNVPIKRPVLLKRLLEKAHTRIVAGARRSPASADPAHSAGTLHGPSMDRPEAIGFLTRAGVFLVVFCFLFWFYGNRLWFTLDEGIFVDGARKMLQGHKLYSDFFGYTSPCSYWLVELPLWLFGLTLRSARVILYVEFSLQCTLVLWITSRLASRAAAWIATFLFFAFQLTQPGLLIPYHWWDGVTFALASIAACLAGGRFGQRRWFLAGGALASAAALCTPTVGLIALVSLAWILFDSKRRRFVGWYALGCAAVAGLVLGYMMEAGLLSGFLEQMRWMRANYSGINTASYGTLTGGYQGAFDGTSGIGLLFRLLMVIVIALPAILPVAGIAGYLTGVILGKRMPKPAGSIAGLGYLTVCLLAFVASTYPRLNIGHLAFVAPLGYIVTAAVLDRLSPRTGWVLAMSFAPLACASLALSIRPAFDVQLVPSPVGTLSVSRTDAPAVRQLLETVRPGDRLFVYPYMPLLYFLTQSENPARFPYMQPGLMTQGDELTVLGDLERHPPRWILYLPMSRERYLDIFPPAARMDTHFRKLEAWIERNYTAADPAVVLSGYRLLAR
ncbi:MAG: hypothetical protein ABSG25_11235, partial [Bryobacteraceae bacterium]